MHDTVEFQLLNAPQSSRLLEIRFAVAVRHQSNKSNRKLASTIISRSSQEDYDQSRAKEFQVLIH